MCVSSCLLHAIDECCRCNECLDVGNDVVDNSMIRVSEQFINAESWVDGQVSAE